ncbi:MAG: HD-GYP domain-containing protein [Pseudomonadales bacterium]
MTESGDKPLILLIDDSAENLQLMSTVLGETFQVRVANRGELGIKLAKRTPLPRVILLDVLMPEMDGYEVLSALQQDAETQHIPVIFLTAKSDEADEKYGLSLGAADYLTKPINPSVTVARIWTQIKLGQAQEELMRMNQHLAAQIDARSKEIIRLQEAAILVVTTLASARFPDASSPARKIQEMLDLFCRELQSLGEYRDDLREDRLEAFVAAAPLYDVGKIGISAELLTKDQMLSEEELEEIKSHTTIALEAMERAEQELGIEITFLKYAKLAALSHHENWDGSGYPYGLRGEKIPLYGRIMRIVDAYIAMRSERAHRKALSRDQAVDGLLAGRGSQFDPVLLDAFLKIEPEITSNEI